MALGQLNAGHLGGRFLKRTIPRKAGSTPDHANSSEDRSPLGDDSVHLFSETQRRACSSAATFGLAVSVGTCGFLFAQTGDAAIAAEPTSAEALALEPSAQAGFSTQDPLTAQRGAAVDRGEASSIPAQSQPAVEHRVQQGQTLWRIAEIYKVNPNQIVSVNQLRAENALRVGQTLQIPASGQSFHQVPSQTPSGEPSTRTAASPTAPSFAAANRSSVPVIASGSADPTAAVPTARLTVNPALLSAGASAQQESLKVSLAELRSEESNAAVPADGSVTYQVSPGETLITIARNHGVSYQSLIKLNNLTNPDQLVANQVIKLPTEKLAAPILPTAVPIVQTATMRTVQPKSEPFAAMGGEAPTSPLRVVESGVLVPQTAAPVGPTDAEKSAPRFSGSLMSEVKSLRERHSTKLQVQAVSAQPVTAQAFASPGMMASRTLPKSSVPVLKPVNPDFLPAKESGLGTLMADARNLSQTRVKRDDLIVPTNQGAVVAKLAVAKLSVAKISAANAEAKQPQLLARAPLGADAYAPVSPSMRRMVAPSLPPIGRPEAYLPGSVPGVKGYIWPAKGDFTSGFGPRWGRMHKGIDVAAPTGTPVVASAPGVVASAGWNSGGYGYLVEIVHPDGTLTLYGHNDSILVRQGDQVSQGQQIARMGSTGHSTGPHTHFEIHPPGQGAVNPMAYLDNRS
jgi:murein DD-endopeptidase MepM/ murein hydrolase activator NlpD